MDRAIRVLVANRPRLMRELVLSALADHPDNEVVGEVSNDAEVPIRVSETLPDFLIITAACLPRLETNIMIGVRAAFDIHAGLLHDSPQWLKQAGLQWCHRLFQEPERLWRRYLLNNPRFLWKISLQLAGLTRYALPESFDVRTASQRSLRGVEDAPMALVRRGGEAPLILKSDGQLCSEERLTP